MRAGHLKCLAFICVLVSCSFSEVFTGKDTIVYNHDLVFSPHSITLNVITTYTPGMEGRVYACTTSIAPIDLFVATRDFPTCTHICYTLAVGSPRPIYLSKSIFDSSYLSSPIDVNDTSRFIKYDTAYDSLGCRLPHIYPMPSGYFIILKNISDTYILTIFDTVMAVDTEYEPMPAYYDYLKGFRITWYLQDNGTLDFTRTGVINDKKYQPIDISNRFDPKGDRIECFTIRGQRITSGSYLGSYIIIERDTKGMIRKRVLYLK